MSGNKLARSVGAAYLRKHGFEVNPGDLGSDLEREFAQAAQLAGLPQPEREVRCIPERKWASDFVWVREKVIVEVEGGTKSGRSRHSKGAGFDEDCRKYAALTLRGWLVLRVTGTHISSGEAVNWVREALSVRGGA